MIFSLAVYGAPQDSQASYSAFQFAHAALQSGHKIYRIFFHHQGVHNGNQAIVYAQDEFNLTEAWQLLAKAHEFDLNLCIASAIHRGILSDTERLRHEKHAANLANVFELVGVGQLVDACVASDRLITFGN